MLSTDETWELLSNGLPISDQNNFFKFINTVNVA